MQFDLVAASAELGQDIRGEHLGVAAGHVDVHIAQAHQAIQHAIEPNGIVAIFHFLLGDSVLYFINEEIIEAASVCNPGTHKRRQIVRIAQFGTLVIIQGNLNDVVVIDTFPAKVIQINLEEKIAFPAAPQTADDLDETVLATLDELLQVVFSLDFHHISIKLVAFSTEFLLI